MRDLLQDPLLTPEFQAIPLKEIFAHNAPPCLKREYIAVLSDPNLSAEDALRVLRAAYCYDGFLGSRPDFGAYLRKNPAWDLWILEDPGFVAACVEQLRTFRAYGDASDFLPPTTEQVGVAVVTGFAPFTDINPPSPEQLGLLRDLSSALRKRWSALWALYLLENPGLQVFYGLESNRVFAALSLLTPQDQRGFVTDVAEMLLPLLTKVSRRDKRPLWAIQIARALSDGTASEEEREAAFHRIIDMQTEFREANVTYEPVKRALVVILNTLDDSAGALRRGYLMAELVFPLGPKRTALWKKCLARMLHYIEGTAYAP